MKKGDAVRNLLFISLSLVVLSSAFVSAGWFSDLFGFTGNAIAERSCEPMLEGADCQDGANDYYCKDLGKGEGRCVECLEDSHCSEGSCVDNKCVTLENEEDEIVESKYEYLNSIICVQKQGYNTLQCKYYYENGTSSLGNMSCSNDDSTTRGSLNNDATTSCTIIGEVIKCEISESSSDTIVSISGIITSEEFVFREIIQRLLNVNTVIAMIQLLAET